MSKVLSGNAVYDVPAPSNPRPPMRRGGDVRATAHIPLRSALQGSGMPGYVQEFRSTQLSALAARYSHNAAMGGFCEESCNGRPVTEAVRADGTARTYGGW